MKKTVKFDLYETVTNKMITLLEKGVSPWRCSWSKYGLARNQATGHCYSGINALLMNLTPHPIPYFMSFKQASEMGGKVKKGSKSEIVLFYKTYFKDANGKSISQNKYDTLCDIRAEPQRISFLKYHRVFNIEDVEGITIDIPEVELKAHEKNENCENIINNMQNPPEFIFKNADRAYYQPSTDCLNMPDIGQFETAEAYYSTLFHELTHSTGHKSRLSREGITEINRDDKKKYSKEELIAEMGASFLSAHTNINNNDLTENSAAYLESWLKVLKADKTIIFKAAAKAQKAVDYILNMERKN